MTIHIYKISRITEVHLHDIIDYTFVSHLVNSTVIAVQKQFFVKRWKNYFIIGFSLKYFFTALKQDRIGFLSMLPFCTAHVTLNCIRQFIIKIYMYT